jgi:hypothetical protein
MPHPALGYKGSLWARQHVLKGRKDRKCSEEEGLTIKNKIEPQRHRDTEKRRKRVPTTNYTDGHG